MSDEPKKQGLTSVEAAALYLSNGQTKDPTLAAVIDENAKNELNMDALQRAHLRRMMGFDFRIKFAPNKIHVSSKQEPYVTTWCKVLEGDVLKTPEGGMLTNDEAINRLVDACARLKTKWDKAKDKEAQA
jgi:hypothetical protein